MTDADIIARTVWGEARGESRQGRLAVAWVIINRHTSGKWFAGDTFAETCLMDRQFSIWNHDNKWRHRLFELDMGNKAFAECMLVSLGALLRDADFQDPTNGSTHYHASNIVPSWAGEGVASNCIIGKHVFYSDID